jgi:Ni/Fe-hydrogenase subunit HybB-like protein
VVVRGNTTYHLWMGFLTFFMVLGAYCYSLQLEYGLAVTGMNDHVSWGLYISNFTFLVGLAAASVMVVMPAYVLHDVDFKKAVLMGEGVAVAALVMCLAFVTVDLGSPANVWHMIPVIGYFHFPQSMLTWDMVVLNGYLLLNLLIPFYVLFSHYRNRFPNEALYLPFVFLSVFWAIGIHLVTAFLYAGLPARPFWHNALLGPRFLASAFAAGPAFIILTLGIIRAQTEYPINRETIQKLSLITTVAAQVNLIMLASEMFKEFYWPTGHGESAQYLFFGLDGHNQLVPWIWTSLTVNIVATIILTIHPLRRDHRWLYPTLIGLFVAIWIEKGMGLIVPGFIPSPLGEIVEYVPTWPEIGVTIGIWAMGLFIFTLLVRIALPIELGKLRDPQLKGES